MPKGPASKMGSSGQMVHSISESAQGFADLPADVVVGVFKHLSCGDIYNVRLVNRAWWKLTSEYADDLYEARCKDLKLLPESADTILGKCAKKTLERAAKVRHRIELCGREWWDTGALRDLYRLHYQIWSHHIHPGKVPAVLDKTCTDPDTWRWVSREKALMFLMDIGTAPQLNETMILKGIRYVTCNDGTGQVMYCAEDVTRKYRNEIGHPHQQEEAFLHNAKR